MKRSIVVVVVGGCLLVFVLPPCVECHGGSGSGSRVMLSILLGTITGSASALVCACLLTLIFRYMRRLPLLKGPVVFSPLISPKSLHSALAAHPDPHPQPALVLNGVTFAVKKLQPKGGSRNNTTTTTTTTRRMLQRQLQTLAALRHRHVMSLMAYLAEADRFYLVYDYVPTGTLEDAMRDNRRMVMMAWDARLRIAVGIIKALQYLHFASAPTLLHYDLRPCNVFLDADFEPRLGNCGLANTFQGIRSSEEACFYAPECFPNFSIYTEKSDIFSFGVILGMLLTGRHPRESLFGEAGGMGMWFRQVVEAGDGRDALDKTLLGEEMEEDEMLMAVRIAAVCLSDMPLDRPSSDELVPMLTQLHSF